MPETPPTARPLVWTAPLLVLLTAVVVAAPVAVMSGAVAPVALGDAGPVVRWGLLVTRVLHDLALSLTLGLLMVAAFLVREGRATDRRGTAARIAAGTAALWLVTIVVQLYLGYGELAGMTPQTPGYLPDLWSNIWGLEPNRLRVVEAGLVALTLVLTLWARTRGALAWTFVAAVAALVPLAFAGHSSSNAGHEAAVTAMGLHLLGLALWVGGLLAIALLLPILGQALPDVVSRYSTVAAWCLGMVTLSGVLFATLTVDDAADLLSPYWLIIWAKVAALGLLGLAGLTMRTRIIAGGLPRPSAFARLATGELVVMGLAMALGVALTRTAPPALTPIDTRDTAWSLTDYPMPKPWTWGRMLTEWEINWLFLLGALLAVGLYVWGMVKLRRRGDRWPVWRLIVWVIGWALFVYTTSGPPAVYGRVMFSVHMVMHMSLMMFIPLFLVPAASITLAYRALDARRDKTLGPREILLACVHSGWANFVVNPGVAGAIFFGSLFVFYWTPMFEWALTTHLGHVFMVVHFSLSGFAFLWSLVGKDPGPQKWDPPLRLLVLLGTLAAHAFFGLSLMAGTWLLAPGFFKALDVPWVTSLIDDQQVGGTIAWGIGELPTVVIVLMVAMDWMRRDERDSQRYDRRAERDHDAELNAYNARLAAIAERDRVLAERARGASPTATEDH